jgi:hypothetical protein
MSCLAAYQFDHLPDTGVVGARPESLRKQLPVSALILMTSSAEYRV